MFSEDFIDKLNALATEYEVKDILKYIEMSAHLNGEDLRGKYIAIKWYSEYGAKISVYNTNSKKHKIEIFINQNDGNYNFHRDFYISSLSFNDRKVGIYENIYSNRTEYFMGEEFLGCGPDKNNIRLENIIIKINNFLIKDKPSQTLYKFMKGYAEDEITEIIMLTKQDVLNCSKIEF